MKLKNISHLYVGFIFAFSLILLGNLPVKAATSYWVQFGAPGKPAGDWNTAEELLEKLNANGIQATEIDRWKNSGWDGHIKDFPFNDFDIKAEEGYFLKVTTDDPNFDNVLTDYESYVPTEYSINSGWNLVNFPKGFKNKYGIDKAEDICKNMGSSITEIAYTEPMEDQLKPIDESPGYKSHECGSTNNNFTIEEAHSYFLKGTSYSTWKPEKMTKTYFVFWGPKGIPADSWNKAEELLEKLSSEGIPATEIDRWKNSGWDGHVKDYPFNDFTVEAGEGYIISVSDPNAKLHDVLDSWTDTSSSTYELQATWNLISFPKALIEGNTQLTKASDLCDYDGIAEVQYARYYEKGTEANYTNYECGDSEDDFSLEAGLGYFVKSSKNTTLELTKIAAATTENNTENPAENDTDKKTAKTETINTTETKQTAAPNALKAITTPIGEILGKDFTNFNFYDSLIILLAFIIVVLIILLIIVLVIYKARKNETLPSIRGYLKNKFAKVFKKTEVSLTNENSETKN
ncbi:hypothetical protein KAZ57_00125 [Patescibacteria group bacterium]|nr:hypothetical protein [Patescibacteria group bacterium]